MTAHGGAEAAQKEGDGAREPVLAPLREDLQFFPAPAEADGSPSWMVLDPLLSRFVKMTWKQREIVRRLDRPQTIAQLMQRLDAETTVRESQEEVFACYADLQRLGFTRDRLFVSAKELLARREKKRQNPLVWLAHHYLYFRIPLLHPDRFLVRTLGLFRLLISRPVLCGYVLLALCGLYFLLTRFDQYVHTFPRFFDLQGAFWYGAAIALCKGVHEFSHAYTARLLGNRVPTMGLAFIVMWPVPFCDVTDAWRMQDRRKRLFISLAGILAELVIAGLTLFLWGLCGEGTLKSVCFILSSVSLAGTLLVNLNPAMRFDGYYLFCDLAGIDNLQARATALWRWYYRRVLYGRRDADPEPALTPGAKGLMAVYAVYAATYRFLLYVSIALLVYYAFDFKLLGILLFLIEVIYFILRPFLEEGVFLVRTRRQLTLNFSSLITLLLVGGLLVWAAVPMPRRASVPAITVPQTVQVLYAAGEGLVTQAAGGINRTVHAGDVLLAVQDEELSDRIRLAKLQIEAAQIAIESSASDEEGRRQLPMHREELTKAESELAGLLAEQAKNIVRAAFDGTIYEWDETVRPGMTLEKRAEAGRLAAPGMLRLLLYLPEKYRAEVAAGKVGRFVPDAGEERYPVAVIMVKPRNTQILEHPALSSEAGNEILVQKEQDGLRVVDAYYEAEADFTQARAYDGLRCGQPGRFWFETGKRSHLADLGDYLWRVLLREANF